MNLAKKFADLPTPPLCPELAALEEAPATSSSKPAAVRSVKWAQCPTHAEAGLTGLVRQGEHLVWRHHAVTIGKGAKVECRSSGARLCDAPAHEPNSTRFTRTKCPCGAS